MDKTREEFDRKLVEQCPLLYADRHGSASKTSMCWGFCIGPGWHQLVRDLSVKLEALIQALPEAERKSYRASQVKEKFGGLRFYMKKATAEMQDLIHQAEHLSYSTCEGCGVPAAETKERAGWISTLCQDCRKKKKRI